VDEFGVALGFAVLGEPKRSGERGSWGTVGGGKGKKMERGGKRMDRGGRTAGMPQTRSQTGQQEGAVSMRFPLRQKCFDALSLATEMFVKVMWQGHVTEMFVKVMWQGHLTEMFVKVMWQGHVTEMFVKVM
jgi:hypothetical protein